MPRRMHAAGEGQRKSGVVGQAVPRGPRRRLGQGRPAAAVRHARHRLCSPGAGSPARGLLSMYSNTVLHASSTRPPTMAHASPHNIGIQQLYIFAVCLNIEQELREVVGEVATASVATGVLGVGGNKGAVAIGFTLHRRRVAFLASHFAAHQVRAAAGNAPAWKGRRMHRSRCLTGSCWLHGPCTPGTVAHLVKCTQMATGINTGNI